MMTLFGKRNYVVLWLLIVNLENVFLIASESLQPPSYLFQPKRELPEAEVLSESGKDSLLRYLVYPYSEEDVEGTHYTKYGIDSESELSFLRPMRRLGSEFLGKRSISSQIGDTGNEKRRQMGSEFLGKKRRLGSEFLGKRSRPLERNEWNEPDFLHTNFPFYASMTYAEDKIPEMDKLYEERENRKLEFKRALGSEFLGKRNKMMSQEQQDSSTSRHNIQTSLHPQFLQEKRRMGSEFLGKRKMGSEFLGKRKMGSEFLGKRKMSSEFLGKRRIGSELLGKRMGTEFKGKRRVGSEFLGKRKMGSEFLGKRRMGSEFLGKRRMGSEFLGKRSMALKFLESEDDDSSEIEKLGKQNLVRSTPPNET